MSELSEAATQPGSQRPTPRSPLSQGRSIAIKGSQAGEDELGFAATQVYAPSQAWNAPQDEVMVDETLEYNCTATASPSHPASREASELCTAPCLATQAYPEISVVQTASDGGFGATQAYPEISVVQTASDGGFGTTQAFPEISVVQTASDGGFGATQAYPEISVVQTASDGFFGAIQAYPEHQLASQPETLFCATQAYSAEPAGVILQDPPATQVYDPEQRPAPSSEVKTNIFESTSVDREELPMTQCYAPSVPFVPTGPILDVVDVAPPIQKGSKRKASPAVRALGAAPKCCPAPGKRRVASPATAMPTEKRRSSEKEAHPKASALVTPPRAAACETPWTPARRLRGKQPPRAPATSKPPRRSAKASVEPPEPCSSELMQEGGAWLRQVGHSLRPSELGEQVEVLGDGWGSGEGSYMAVVTEADRFTFTVVAVGGRSGSWSQAHVLRQQCILKSSGGRGSSSDKVTGEGKESSVLDCCAAEA